MNSRRRPALWHGLDEPDRAAQRLRDALAGGTPVAEHDARHDAKCLPRFSPLFSLFQVYWGVIDKIIR